MQTQAATNIAGYLCMHLSVFTRMNFAVPTHLIISAEPCTGITRYSDHQAGIDFLNIMP